MLNSLYQTCLSLGVNIHLDTKVKKVDNKLYANNQLIDHNVVFLAAGSGVEELSDEENQSMILKRASFFLHAPDVHFRSSVHLREEGLTVRPVPDGLGTLFNSWGQTQPYLTGDYRNAMPMEPLQRLCSDVERVIGAQAMKTASVYPCVKVEFNTPDTDEFYTQPGAVIRPVTGLDHANVYACLPGKWSLAHYITDQFVEQIEGTTITTQALKEKLVIDKSPPDSRFVGIPSWKQALGFTYANQPKVYHAMEG